jgi:hypothetical protein
VSDWKTLADMLGLKIRTIDAWPGKLLSSWQREKGPYSASLKDTLGMLKTELNFMSARDIVLQAAFRERDLRLDGLPRAGVNTEHPGIILCFNVPGVPGKKLARRRAFDKFTRWEHNLRALAMNLHHLRMANIYGVEGDEQQYAGWKALPPPPADNPAVAELSGDPAEAARYLWAVSGLGFIQDDVRKTLADSDAALLLIRNAQQKAHPDMGGNPETFLRVMAAAEIVKKRHSL